ncbi:unnamed protein product [Prunus armeniaca]|uniref:Malic enzyme NAD-binding domain-containing protein n=1 Tax=Prunus armeniaca TaxID=36596 RepID=A0A6J5TIS6_PRUAR|nr:unnamed protein product [Prunus armeniaca]CAB4294380.1 unnamed protein product [Prunus armeniaca]
MAIWLELPLHSQCSSFLALASDLLQLLVGGSLADHKFLFLGAGKVDTGIAELIALEVSKQIFSLLFVLI